MEIKILYIIINLFKCIKSKEIYYNINYLETFF